MAETNLEIFQGTKKTFNLSTDDQAGDFNFTSVQAIHVTVVKSFLEPTALINLDSVNETSQVDVSGDPLLGEWFWIALPANTSALAPGKYKWMALAVFSATDKFVLGYGSFLIKHNFVDET